MSRKVRLGIVGFGNQGSQYARLIEEGRVPNVELAAITDTDSARREQIAEKYPDVARFEDYVAMLESGAVEAVVTTVPHYLHPQMGIQALERGIHVLVEKPAGVYTKQVRELNEFAASKPGLTFAIMFNQRTNPLYRRLKEIVDSGEIGAIRRTNWIITTWYRPQAYYDSSAWRATWGGEGGGVLVNQAPHQLDLWQWICGVPQRVFAKAGYGFRRNIAVEDEVVAVVDYGDGATGTFTTATHELVGTDRFEITGDRGKIVVTDSKTAVVTRFRAPEQEINAGIPPEDVWRMTSDQFNPDDYYTQETLEFDTAWGGQHAAVLENFAANILDGTPLIASGSDGILGVRLANAIHLSSWTGKEVPIDFDEDEFLAELNKKIAEEGKFPQRG
ncbi:Gfo/Idh/MocA family oxidoreductase [Sinomonas sp. JGH33]|uniref:Gfo/Idh/MocA family oxidoreductase n=1 Tax=Sinomonas terricola TaxID=3110330 RepID=A0ABU5T612_9MICC|nr:Gfo/Idh/MocA family oxidoreductase [Sinomonas sp. JGH33]MEA5455094.1 Gfo/Idh/MocA family oxidoreductase [Sinomonas sp. JGH33]